MKKLFQLFVVLFLAMNSASGQALWVHFGANGTLVYNTDNLGNRLPDFSYAGFMGGGVALPTNVPVKVTLNPSGGDDTSQIQSALTSVSGMATNASGFRGAVLLKAGTYTIAGNLTISASGVVLRGEGNNLTTGTVLHVTGLARNVLTVGGSGSTVKQGSSVAITNSYVSLGATNFNVSSASTFSVGDFIMVQRPQTQPWIDALGMNVTNINWPPGTGLTFERQITAINGTQITIDIPLCNPIEQTWTTGMVYRVTDSARISLVGVENLCAVGQIADYPSNILTGTFAVYQNLKNSWMRDVLMSGWGNGVSLNSGIKWCTVQDCQYVNPATGTSSAAPAAYTIGNTGAMCLFQRCTSSGGYYHIMVTQAGTPGPNAFVNFTSSGTHFNGGPHQRWAAGALHDNINMAADTDNTYTPYLAINNRGTDGSGQGWAAGFSIMYNCQVPQFQLEQPNVTNTYNWVIGGIGSKRSYSDQGIYDTLGTIVSPRSLYVEQLRERLGPAAVEAIGYLFFTVAAAPSTQTVAAGASTSFPVNVAATNFFNDTVALSVSGLPVGATSTFTSTNVTGSGSSTLGIFTTGATSLGTYPLTITGTSSNATQTALVTLVVATPIPFNVSATPSSQNIIPGGNTSFTNSLTVSNGFTNTITFGVSGLPGGVGASFNPPTLIGSGTSTLLLSSTSGTTPGSYPLTISGTGSNLTSSTTVTLVVGHIAVNIKWATTSSSLWDVTNSVNWFNPASSTAAQFFQGDSVLFDDTPGVMNTITLNAGIAVTPAALTNDSSVNNFTIGGAGKISGATGIVKKGTGTLTINTANDFTGGVTISGGILKAGNATALGAASGATVIASGGTLDLNGLNLSAESLTVSGAGAGGNGAIVNSGASQTTALKLVTLTGDTTFGGTGRWDIRGSGASLLTGGQPFKITKVGTNQISFVALTPIDAALGDIDIQQGELAIQTTTTQLGDANKTITVRSNATLEVWALTGSPLNKKITLNDGATVFNESGTSVIIGASTLQGTDTFNVAGTSLVMSNVLSGPGGLTKVGASPLLLTANNGYTGSTLVSVGTLTLTNNGAISGSTNITISAGATLNASARGDATLTLASGQTLAGNGTVTGSLIAGPGATVAPGTGSGLPGILTVAGAVMLQGTTSMELNQSGSTNDVLQAGTSMNYGGRLALTNLSGTLIPGSSFKLFSAAAYGGVFTNLTPAMPGSGLAWDVSGLTNGILKVIAAPQPRFASSTWSGANLIFSGSNGLPGTAYYVLYSTNTAMPLGSWTRMVTNAFDGSGNFSFTNPVDPTAPQRFYLIQLP